MPRLLRRPGYVLCRHPEGRRADLPADLHPHHAKVAFAKLYDRKTPITAAEILNDRVVPFYDEHGIRLSRVLTDRGTEFCGTQSHEYELYLAVEDIDHSRTKTKSPQTNGICERFHRTVLDEFYRVAFRKKIYRTIDELQTDLDVWITEYNEHRPHQGRWCFGKTPMQTFLDALPLAKEKLMAAGPQATAQSVRTANTVCPIKSQLIQIMTAQPIYQTRDFILVADVAHGAVASDVYATVQGFHVQYLHGQS